MDKVSLVSGMDSLITWYALEKPLALYFNLGHRYNSKEEETVKDVITRRFGTLVTLNSLKLGQFEEPDACIPGRNVHLALMAAHYGDEIYLTVQKGETNIPDRTPEAFEVMTKAVQIVGPNKVVKNLWWDHTKAQMINWYLEQDFPVEDLLDISTCYSQSPELYCSACPACFRKFIALEFCGVDTRSHINRETMLNWEGTKTYLENMRAGKYIEDRVNETLTVLKKFGID